MPLFLLHDEEFMDLAMEKACELEGSMHKPRTELTNAQTKFKSFKDSVTELTQKRAKTAVGASEKKWKALVNKCEVLLKTSSPKPKMQWRPTTPPLPQKVKTSPLGRDPPSRLKASHKKRLPS
jgi:hypothetical protein